MRSEWMKSLLKSVRDELADRKWSTWTYIEGFEMSRDLANIVNSLDMILEELNRD